MDFTSTSRVLIFLLFIGLLGGLPPTAQAQKLTPTRDWLWAQSLPGQAAGQLAADATGKNFYATGNYWSRFVWDQDTLLSSPSQQDSYLLRHARSAAGNWARQLAGTSIDIATDQRGQVHVLGFFAPTPSVSREAATSAIQTNTAAAYVGQVLRYDSLGQLRGQWRVPGRPIAFAIGKRGQVVVLHSVDTTQLSYLESLAYSQSLARKVRLSCFDPAGIRQWTQLVTDSTISLTLRHRQRILGIDNRGGVWLTGGFNGTINLAHAQTLHGPLRGVNDFLLYYNAQGKLIQPLHLTSRLEENLARPLALALSHKGEVYVAGYFDSTVVHRAGGQALPVADHGSVLLRLRRRGQPRGSWSLPHTVEALALDRSGQIYVLGSTTTTSNQPLQGDSAADTGSRVWIGCYNRQGQLLASAHSGGHNQVSGSSLALGADGVVCVAGEIHSVNRLFPSYNAGFGPFSFNAELNYAQDLHIVYDSTGRVQAAQRLNPRDSPNEAQLDGYTDNDPGSLNDFYTLAERATRPTMWPRPGRVEHASLVNNGLALALPMVADARGNSYALCHLHGYAGPVGPGDTLSDLTPPGQDYVLLKYGPKGPVRWVRQLTVTTQYVKLTQLVADEQGNVFVAGELKGELTFGPKHISSKGSPSKLVVAKYDSLGQVAWVQSIAADHFDYGLRNPAVDGAVSLAADGQGGVYCAGAVRGTLVAGQGRRPSVKSQPHQTRGYVLAFGAAGTLRWLRSIRITTSQERLLDQLQLSTNGTTGALTLAVRIEPALHSALVFEAGPLGTPAVRQPIDTLSSPLLLVRYDRLGRLRWIQPADAERQGWQNRTLHWNDAQLATNARGVSYLIGYTNRPLTVRNSQLSLATGTVPYPGGRSFLASYDTAGHAGWVQELDARYRLNSIVAGLAGTYYLAGDYLDQPLGPKGETANPIPRTWVGAYAAGQPRWVSLSTGDNAATHLGLSLDGRGRLHQICQLPLVRPPAVAETTHFGSWQLNDLEPTYTYFQRGSNAFLATLRLSPPSR